MVAGGGDALDMKSFGSHPIRPSMRADKISKKNRMAHGSGGSSASRAQTTKGRSRYE